MRRRASSSPSSAEVGGETSPSPPNPSLSTHPAYNLSPGTSRIDYWLRSLVNLWLLPFRATWNAVNNHGWWGTDLPGGQGGGRRGHSETPSIQLTLIRISGCYHVAMRDWTDWLFLSKQDAGWPIQYIFSEPIQSRWTDFHLIYSGVTSLCISIWFILVFLFIPDCFSLFLFLFCCYYKYDSVGTFLCWYCFSIPQQMQLTFPQPALLCNRT